MDPHTLVAFQTLVAYNFAAIFLFSAALRWMYFIFSVMESVTISSAVFSQDRDVRYTEIVYDRQW